MTARFTCGKKALATRIAKTAAKKRVIAVGTVAAIAAGLTIGAIDNSFRSGSNVAQDRVASANRDVKCAR